MKRKIIFVALTALAVIVCWRISTYTPVKPVISFYYWRTVFKLSDSEKALVNDLNVQKIYVRYFDVKGDISKVYPVAVIDFQEKPTVEVVPVVFIQTSAFDAIKNGRGDFCLSDSLFQLVSTISKASGVTVKEIQLDCDWNESCKNDFFETIDNIRTAHPDLIVSSTIRLHQVKYQERTGIPNVHSGTLMYYNMGRIGADTLNSIYDRDLAMQYVTALDDYSLPLNVALPLFSWGVQSRGNDVVDLLNKISFSELKSDTLFQQISERVFEAKHNGVFENRYIAQGDRIKLEFATPADLKQAISDISKYIEEVPKEIILYDLDQINFQNQVYEKDFFHSLCASF